MAGIRHVALNIEGTVLAVYGSALLSQAEAFADQHPGMVLLATTRVEVHVGEQRPSLLPVYASAR